MRRVGRPCSGQDYVFLALFLLLAAALSGRQLLLLLFRKQRVGGRVGDRGSALELGLLGGSRLELGALCLCGPVEYRGWPTA
jgi:hypothetical protein